MIKRTRAEEEAFLETMRSVQEDKLKSATTQAERRSRSIRTMIQGIVFFGLMMLFDIGYRKYKLTDDIRETVFFLLLLMAAVGALQFPIGLYSYIKSLWEKQIPSWDEMGKYEWSLEEEVKIKGKKEEIENAPDDWKD